MKKDLTPVYWKRVHGAGGINVQLAQILILVQEILNSIALDNPSHPFADWQENEIKSRYEQYKSGMVSLHDWPGVHQKLRIPGRKLYGHTLSEYSHIKSHIFILTCLLFIVSISL